MILTFPALTTGEAARLAGMTEKTLRNWLDRSQVSLPSPKGKKQIRLSMLDCVKLSAVARAVNYGFSVEFSNDAVDTELGRAFKLLAKNDEPQFPWKAFDDLDEQHLIIFRDFFGKSGSFIAADLNSADVRKLDSFVSISIKSLTTHFVTRWVDWICGDGESRWLQISASADNDRASGARSATRKRRGAK